MGRFWKAAVGAAGIGAVAFFVFHNLYNKWLSLPIFSPISSDQTFKLMAAFLGLTFLALIVGVVAWLAKGKTGESEDAALHRLEQAWTKVNYIDCENLVGPDVNIAGNALEMTAIYWQNGFISRKLIAEKYGKNFSEIFDQINSCDKQVPGYNKPEKFCKDFLSALVKSTYLELKNYGI